MSKNVFDFVSETLLNIEKFEPSNRECVRGVIRKAIAFYKLKSYEEVEQIDSETIHILHIYSMMEENLLSKVAELSVGHGCGGSIESVYCGKIYRHY